MEDVEGLIVEDIEKLMSIKDILACPNCKGELELNGKGVQCTACPKSYAVFEGIPCFVDFENHPESREIKGRDRVADESLSYNENEILKEITRHHFVSLMRKKVDIFLNKLGRNQFILDVGAGWGWHWFRTQSHHRIICLDFSLKSLLVAKKLLKDKDNVFLICADACSMPFKNGCFTGIWSVQTYQHLPPDLFNKAMEEAGRVLETGGYFEIRWLNDSCLLRLAYLLKGKKYQKECDTDLCYLRRLSGKDLIALFNQFEDFNDLRVFYDEFLFHPVLKFTHNSGFLVPIDILLSSVPFFNRLVANQSDISGLKK